jgi:TPP-dependent 2-oxoacid decarboxylase
MKRIQISTIAIALSALFTGQAIAQDSAPLTRTQVQAEMVEAINTGHVMVTESGRLANDVFSSNYSVPQVESLTRAEVLAELAEAINKGQMIISESGRLANDVFSSNYPQQENVSSKTREEVRNELVEAIANGSLDKHISA